MIKILFKKGDKKMNHSEETVRERGKGSIYRSPVRSVFDKFGKNKDVTLIYGEPISHEKQCIIPVSKMSYFFGGGGGGGETNATEDKTSIGQGEGGGGFFSIRPLGVYKITADRVRFKPAVDLKFILTIFSVLTLGVTFLLKKKR